MALRLALELCEEALFIRSREIRARAILLYYFYFFVATILCCLQKCLVDLMDTRTRIDTIKNSKDDETNILSLCRIFNVLEIDWWLCFDFVWFWAECKQAFTRSKTEKTEHNVEAAV